MTESVMQGLQNLHTLLQQLSDVKAQIEQGPKKIKNREAFVAKKQAALDAKHTQIIGLKKAADQRSLQLKTNEAKILELRGKLNAASSNKEFDIIKSQIEADTMANSVLEDEILEALDKVDQALIAQKDIEAELKSAQQSVEELKAKIKQSQPGLEAEAVRLQNEIAQAEKAVIPENLKERYRRLINSKQADAMAHLDKKACSACYTMFSPQEIVQLNTEKIIFCRSCARLLYKIESD